MIVSRSYNSQDIKTIVFIHLFWAMFLRYLLCLSPTPNQETELTIHNWLGFFLLGVFLLFFMFIFPQPEIRTGKINKVRIRFLNLHTFPYLLNRFFRSVARVVEDSPLTHRFLPELLLMRPGAGRRRLCFASRHNSKEGPCLRQQPSLTP